MIKIVRRLNPFSSYEIEYLESWLTDMAKHGLILDNITLCFASFAQGEPKNRRYRILPKAFGSVSKEEKDFYSQQQWNFDFSFSGLNVFYTDNEDAEELFTDAASFKSYTKKYAAFTILFLLAIPYIYYRWVIGEFNDFQTFMPSLHRIQENGLLLTILLASLVVLALFYVIRMVVGSILLMVKIKKNIKLSHDKPYKKAYKLYKLITVLTLVALIGVPIGMIVSHNYLGTTISFEETISYHGTHPVMLKEIDEKHASVIQQYLNKHEMPENMDYSIDNYWDGLFKRIVSEDARIDEGEQNGVTYIATYYNARSEGIAERYLIEDIPYHIDEDVTMDDIKIKCDGIDYAGYYSSTRDSFQYLFVLNGTQLETVVYQGEKNLKDYLELFVDDISNK